MMRLAEKPERHVLEQASRRAQWQAALLPLGLGLLLLSYHGTVAELASTWLNSATFAHGILIPPVSLWLIWRQRAAWLPIAVRPAPLMLIPLASAGLGWLLAALGSVPVVQQFCLVGMLIALTTLLQGLERSRAQAFPLLYLLLAVPCGEFLIPPLIEITTTMTVAAVRLVGVPVLRENNFLSLPSGNWSVMDACSGLRYLIATIAIASLYAYLNFYSWQRRLLFMLAALLLPILANGMRAFGIVLLGHYSNMRWATGIDHLLYGWLFFGLLLAMLLRGGARWREVSPPQPAMREQPASIPSAAGRAIPLGLMIAALATISLWPLLAQHFLRAMESPAPVTLYLPAPPAPWQVRSQPDGASPELKLTGQALWGARYQHPEHSVTLQLLRPLLRPVPPAASPAPVRDDPPHWQVLDTRQRSITVGTQQLPVQQLLLRDGARKLLVWRCYRLAGSNFSSDWEIRVRQAASLLRGRRDMVSEIRLAAEYDEVDQAPDAAMHALLTAMYGAILLELDHAAP